MALFGKKDDFGTTLKISNMIDFNDNERLLRVHGPKRRDYIYRYDEIRDFELINDGGIVVKGGGLGRAIVGGVIAGTSGAIIGGTSKKHKQTINRLEVKIYTTQFERPVEIIELIGAPMKVGTLTNEMGRIAEKIVRKLDEIVAQNSLLNSQPVQQAQQNPSQDPVQELQRYAALLRDGIITQEEFNRKKQELLGSSPLF